MLTLESLDAFDYIDWALISELQELFPQPRQEISNF